MKSSAPQDGPPWFPLFEFQDWIYQSYLVLPQADDAVAAPGAPINAKKWSMGVLLFGQAFNADSGRYTLSGTLRFPSGVELAIITQGSLGSIHAPASFEATATGTHGALKGMVSELVGWVFPELPIANAAARVLCVRGAIRAVRGTDAKPEIDPSGMPLGTVGTFVIARAN